MFSKLKPSATAQGRGRGAGRRRVRRDKNKGRKDAHVPDDDGSDSQSGDTSPPRKMAALDDRTVRYCGCCYVLSTDPEARAFNRVGCLRLLVNALVFPHTPPPARPPALLPPAFTAPPGPSGELALRDRHGGEVRRVHEDIAHQRRP